MSFEWSDFKAIAVTQRHGSAEEERLFSCLTHGFKNQCIRVGGCSVVDIRYYFCRGLKSVPQHSYQAAPNCQELQH